MVSKIDQLRMDLPSSGIDILTISESWLNSDTEDKLTSIPNYSIIRLDRQVKHSNGQAKAGGGLCIYYRDHLQIDPNSIATHNISNGTLELQWVVVSRPHTKKIIIGNVYRPPDGKLKDAFEIISNEINHIENIDRYELLIMGDFNADASKNELPPARIIKQFEAEHTLTQVITKPTRYSKRTKTTIDLAFTNIKYCTGSGTLNYNISDHKPIYILKKKLRNDERTKTHWGRSYRNYSHEELAATLSTYLAQQAINSPNPNECWKNIESYITRAVDKHCPLIEMKIKATSAPFITNELIELQNDRDYFVQKADQSNDPGDRFIANCMAKVARKEVRKAKANYFLNQAIVHNQNNKKFWHEYYKIQPNAKVKITNIYDEISGLLVPDKQLPDNINNYFIDIGERLAEKCPHIDDQDKIYTPPKNPNSLKLEHVDEVQIKERISKINTDKPSGMTNVGTTFYKEAMSIMSKEFTYLYNLVIDTGIFPDGWKVATVTPIPKVNNPSSCNELRPISILPLPGKLMEQIIHDQVKKFLEETKFFTSQQNGFRSQHSTTKALATLIDQLLENMDNGELSVSVFIDFKKAFDTIDHKILIKKLRLAGMSEEICNLISNYLKNRTQMTKINGETSKSRTVKTGVPQGSTLGPLLFLIFINDLPLLSKSAEFILFADDAVLIIHDKSLTVAAHTMNQVLRDVHRWCSENKLTLNTKKTEYVIFGSKIRKAQAPQIELKIGDAVLKEVESYKYLGTVLDATLTIAPQLDKLNRTLAPKLASFRKMRYCMSQETAAYIYKATILPIFDYNDVIYHLLNSQQETKLQRIQNRALRIVFMGKTLSVAEMHSQAGVDFLEKRRNLHLLALMHNRSQNPKYIEKAIRNTRQNSSKVLTVPQPKATKFMKAPKYKGSKLWNSLPPKIRNIGSFVGFKVAVKATQTEPDPLR